MSQKEKLRKKKFLRNKKSFIFVTILCMGIGFAFLTSNLTITGNTSVSGNKWSVYFTNVVVSDGSVEASVIPTTSGTNTTSIDYTVTLDKPGDFYEFTVDAVNDGTIDAMIENINMTSLNSDVEKYLSFTAKYSDGIEINAKDILNSNSRQNYKIRVEFKKNILAEDLDEEGINLTLTFGINYKQYIPETSQFISLVKKDALKDTSINFKAISSDSNGKGLYVRNGTEENTYPIYYYRGAVTNNNALFAGFCWKIVRTTDTGGTKLIYNGLPDANGRCTNTTGTATQIASVEFNTDPISPAHNGYMYGTVYPRYYTATNSSYIYGNSFTYENGVYTLVNTKSGVDNSHHYTCLSTSTTCTNINYAYVENENQTYYITIANGKSIEDALEEMNQNINNSTAKIAVDNWFNNTFKTYFTANNKNYNDYLEDTIWCNDRTPNTLGSDQATINNGWKPNGGGLQNVLRYNAYGRRNTGAPSVNCSNKNDSFTVRETRIGNGALTYPVGLLTSDELILAGATNAANTSYYLYTNQNWWSMSPCDFYINYTFIFHTQGSDGALYGATDPSGIRPSISLKPEVKIASGGDGTATNPYEFVVE